MDNKYAGTQAEDNLKAAIGSASKLFLYHQILTFPSISDNALKISPSWNGLWIR